MCSPIPSLLLPVLGLLLAPHSQEVSAKAVGKAIKAFEKKQDELPFRGTDQEDCIVAIDYGDVSKAEYLTQKQLGADEEILLKLLEEAVAYYGFALHRASDACYPGLRWYVNHQLKQMELEPELRRDILQVATKKERDWPFETRPVADAPSGGTLEWKPTAWLLFDEALFEAVLASECGEEREALKGLKRALKVLSKKGFTDEERGQLTSNIRAIRGECRRFLGDEGFASALDKDLERWPAPKRNSGLGRGGEPMGLLGYFRAGLSDAFEVFTTERAPRVMFELQGVPSNSQLGFVAPAGVYEEHGFSRDNALVVYTIWMEAKRTGPCALLHKGDDGFLVLVNDQVISDEWHGNAVGTIRWSPCYLQAGCSYKVNVVAWNSLNDCVAKLRITPLPDDAELARNPSNAVEGSAAEKALEESSARSRSALRINQEPLKELSFFYLPSALERQGASGQ